jgi:hypothetical protein
MGKKDDGKRKKSERMEEGFGLDFTQSFAPNLLIVVGAISLFLAVTIFEAGKLLLLAQAC